MAGLFALSIDKKNYRDDFIEDLFWGTFYQQHLGEHCAGLSVFDSDCEEKIIVYLNHGLIRPIYNTVYNKELKNFRGTEGIGYCGSAEEPFKVEDSKLGKFSICFSGNIINHQQLIEKLEKLGHSLQRKDDIEIITKLILQEDSIIKGLKKIAQEIKGAYTLLLLTGEGVYAHRCPTAHWPLVVGKKEGGIVVASGAAGFNNLGFKLERDLLPGEILLLKNGRDEIKEIITGEKIQFCSFCWVYTSFPNEKLEGISVSEVRKKLGACQAQKDILKGFIPDIIVPVPDSGRFHAIGYHQEFCRQMNRGQIKKIPLYDEVLLKFPYAGRSFTPQTQQAREKEAKIKLVESGENYQGKIAVVCDDSIVRGTQIKTNLVPKLRKIGIKEIHFRISNPEILSYCPFGKTVKKKEALVSQIPIKEDRIKFLGIDGLEHNTIKDLVEAIGLPKEKLCLDCTLGIDD